MKTDTRPIFPTLACAAALTLIAACGEASSGTITPDVPPPPAPFARCLNMGSALEAEYEGAWGYVIEDRHIDAIAEAGFDAVRFPIRWSAHAGRAAPYNIDPAFLERVDHVVRHALDAGLTVMINVHHYHDLMTDPGAHYDRLDAIWAQIARHYADWPEALIFELVNEPHSELEGERLEALNDRLLATVRQTNPDRWVVAPGEHWGNLEGLLALTPPDDPRVMATLHYYTPFAFTHQGAPWTDQRRTGIVWGSPRERAETVNDLTEAARYAAAHDIPVFIGEFGVYEPVPIQHRVAWTRHVREQAEALGLAWCHWEFSSTFPVYDTENDAWIDPIRDALLD